MTLATAILFAVAIFAVHISRQPNSTVMSNIGVAILAGVVVAFARIALTHALARKLPGSTSQHTLAVAVVLIAVVTALSLTPQYQMTNEERVMAWLLCIAAALFVCGASRVKTSQSALFQSSLPKSALSKCAIISTVVTLMAVPGTNEAHRLLIVIALAWSGVTWLVIASRERGPRVWLTAIGVSACVVGVIVVAHQIIKPTDGNPSYAAFVPSSGGTEEGDDLARRGKGEGPDEIAGNSPDSVGFDNSDNFSESGKDGLYDLWIESYGAPVKSEDQKKMVGIKPQDVNIVAAPDRENLGVGKSFEIKRKRAESTSSASSKPDVQTAAAMWVKGPMPAYVPLAAFADFTGDSWQAIDHGKGAVPVRLAGNSTWMEILLRPSSTAFRGSDSHEIRVGNLGGDVLPFTPIVERFKMGRVNKPQFFLSSQAGLVRLATRTLPQGATLQVQSKRVDPSRLVGVEPALPRNSDPRMLRYDGLSLRAAELTREWANANQDDPSLDRGWRQIESVIRRLREHVQHDRDAIASNENGIDQLLFETRRGTDYQIATAAVLMLRSLSYPTRLVSGLYADESDVDARSGFAALTSAHTHFWIEVRLADGTWITLDPTPGYAMFNLPAPPGEWLAQVLRASKTRAMADAPQIVLVMGVATGFWMSRKRIIDLLMTWRCQRRGYSPIDVLKVIERRARLAGEPRPIYTPPGQWLGQLISSTASVETGDQLIAALNRDLYHHSDRSFHKPAQSFGPGKDVLDRLSLGSMHKKKVEAQKNNKKT